MKCAIPEHLSYRLKKTNHYKTNIYTFFASLSGTKQLEATQQIQNNKNKQYEHDIITTKTLNVLNKIFLIVFSPKTKKKCILNNFLFKLLMGI